MAANHVSTIRAAPLFPFLFQELLDAMTFDELQVFYHAHMVFGAVALIKGNQPIAGEIVTIKAKPNKSFPNQIAMLFHEGTILTAWQAPGTVRSAKSLVFQIVFKGQVIDA